MEYSLNLQISEPITMNTPLTTEKHSSNSPPCWCSFNGEQQNKLLYAEIDFNRKKAKAPPAQKQTQYSSVKVTFALMIYMYIYMYHL